MSDKPCQTVDFYLDWQCIQVFRVFFASGDRLVSQEEMLRQTGLRKDTLENAISRINRKVQNCIAARPEYDDMHGFNRIGKAVSEWLKDEIEANFQALFYGKWTFKSRRALGYKMAGNVEIHLVSKDNAVVRVYKNGD